MNKRVKEFLDKSSNYEVIEYIGQLQQENKQLKATLEMYENGVYFSSENDKLKEENKQLKEQLLVTQDNEETFRLEMEDITQTLGLDEGALFDDVKAYAGSLKDNWNKLKKYIKETKLKEFEKSYGKRYGKTFTQAEIIICNIILDKMQELENRPNNNKITTRKQNLKRNKLKYFKRKFTKLQRNNR